MEPRSLIPLGSIIDVPPPRRHTFDTSGVPSFRLQPFRLERYTNRALVSVSAEPVVDVAYTCDHIDLQWLESIRNSFLRTPDEPSFTSRHLSLLITCLEIVAYETNLSLERVEGMLFQTASIMAATRDLAAMTPNARRVMTQYWIQKRNALGHPLIAEMVPPPQDNEENLQKDAPFLVRDQDAEIYRRRTHLVPTAEVETQEAKEQLICFRDRLAALVDLEAQREVAHLERSCLTLYELAVSRHLLETGEDLPTEITPEVEARLNAPLDERSAQLLGAWLNALS